MTLQVRNLLQWTNRISNDYSTTSSQIETFTKDENPLQVIFWNARSVVHRLPELRTLLKGIDIFICVETWLTEDVNIHVPGYSIFRKDRIHSRGGGLLMLIHNDLIYGEILDLISPDISVELGGIYIKNTNPPVNIIACYRTPGTTLSQNQWDVIFNNVKTNSNTIIVGDFNSHNIIWNCKDNNTNGLRLENSLEKYDLIFHNNNSFTYVNMYHNIKSNLDLLVSTIILSDKIDFRVNNDSWGSDHFAIFFNINVTKSYYNKKYFKIKSLRTE